MLARRKWGCAMTYWHEMPASPTGFATQRHEGEASIHDVEHGAREMIALYESPGFSGLLMDVSKSQPIFSPADLIGVIDEIYPRFGKGFPIAYVLHARDHDVEQMILQTLAYNHGLTVRFFTEVESAQVWLVQQTADS